jgi:hypothetical protein
MNAARLLGSWGWDIPDEEYDEELQAMLGPSGRRFPGLANPTSQELDPELTRRALASTPAMRGSPWCLRAARRTCCRA